MIASGLTAEKVLDLYEQKHAVNRARQETGYSKATKNEVYVVKPIRTDRFES